MFKHLLIILILASSFFASAQEYVMVWHDEFNEPGLPDSTKWNYEVGKVRNSELQYYTNKRNENARIEDTVLILEARKENYKGADYTSASIISKGIGDWRYGKIEISAKVPTGKGTWPALWMMPTYSEYGGWPRSGEIDIMEYIGVEPENLFYTAHFEGTDGDGHDSHGNGGNSEIAHPYNQFIKFTLIWTPEKLEWYANEVKYHEYVKPAGDYRTWPFDKEFYLILNLAYGGSWGGYAGVDDSLLPHKFLIDYVRVFQSKESEPPFELNILPAEGGTVEITPELELYPDGTEVTLTAIPDSNFAFLNWKHVSEANPFTFVIKKNATIQPVFFDTEELILNSKFNENWDNWDFYVNNDGSIDYSTEIVDSTFVVDITNTSETDWHLGFQQLGFSMEKGYYSLKFSAKSDLPDELLIMVAKNYGDWSSYISQKQSINNNLTDYEMTLKMPVTDKNIRLFFGIGKFNGKFAIDNISLKKIKEHITKIEIEDENASLFSEQSKSFNLSVWNQYNDLTDALYDSIKWSCTENIGSFDGNSLFTANGDLLEGYVYAKHKTFVDSCLVSVQPIGSVIVTPDTLVIDTLNTFDFQMEAFSPEGSKLNVPSELFTWSVVDPNSSSINESGLFTPIASGMTKVTGHLFSNSDTTLVSIECGQNFIHIDSLTNIDDWIVESQNLDSLSLTLPSEEDSVDGFFINYHVTYSGATPKLTFKRPIRLFGLPDSIFTELESTNTKLKVDYLLSTKSNSELNVTGEVSESSAYLDRNTISASTVLTDYPLTFKNIGIELIPESGEWVENEHYSGTVLLKKLLVSYPGHTPIQPEQAYFTGISPNDFDSTRISIYPNPVKDILHITLETEINTENNIHIEIINIYGTVVDKFTARGPEIDIDVSQKNSGFYLLKLNISDSVKVIPFLHY